MKYLENIINLFRSLTYVTDCLIVRGEGGGVESFNLRVFYVDALLF